MAILAAFNFELQRTLVSWSSSRIDVRAGLGRDSAFLDISIGAGDRAWKTTFASTFPALLPHPMPSPAAGDFTGGDRAKSGSSDVPPNKATNERED